MIRYVLMQCLGLAATLLAAGAVIFVALDLPAGGPAGIDAPAPQRFFGWIGGMLAGDFGFTAEGQAVGPLLAERLGVTLPLALLAMGLAVAIGLPLGIAAARRRGSFADRGLMALAQLGVAVPGFWLGMVLVLLFSVTLRWLPAGGFVPWGENPGAALASLLLPAIALALPAAAGIGRVLREALLEVAGSDFIRSARARGLTRRAAMWRHGMRPALLPVLGGLGRRLAGLVAGTVIVETVFYLPGLGRLILDGIGAGEPAVVRSGVSVLVVVIVGTAFLATIVAAWLDPRGGARPGDGRAGPARGRRARPPRTRFRIGAAASLLFLLAGFVSTVWVPYPVESLDVGAAMLDPGPAHWLGTDHLGRDMLSLLMKGTLTSVVVAAIAVGLGALIGVPLGLAAAAWGGPADWLADRVGDFLVALPALVVAILAAAVSGPSAINVMVAVGLCNIPVFARATRNGAFGYRGLDYVAAARLAGMGTFEIARRHVLPDLANRIAVQALFQLAFGVLAEASLSYVGLGTQPPATSLGLMLREAQTYALLHPALVLTPGLAIVLIVVALNLAGAGLRDQLVPPLHRAGGVHGAA